MAWINFKNVIAEAIKTIDRQLEDFQENRVRSVIKSFMYFSGLAKRIKGEIKSVKDVRPYIGYFYLFYYESKLYNEGKLPFYDSYPLILVVNTKGRKDMFLGINFHYILPHQKAKVLKYIFQTWREQFFNDAPLIPISYKKLVSVLGPTKKQIRYAIKWYRYDHLKKFKGYYVMRINNTEMINSIAYVSPKWINISENEVAQEIRKEINKT